MKNENPYRKVKFPLTGNFAVVKNAPVQSFSEVSNHPLESI